MPENLEFPEAASAPKAKAGPAWKLRWPQRLPASPAPSGPTASGPTPSHPDDLAAIWRARAVRYTLIYVALVVALLGMRYATRNTYPQLRDLRAEISTLQTQRDTLDLQVQQLTTGPRILEWARTHDMVPYAQAAKQSATFAPLPAPETPTAQPLSVQTQWH